MFGEAYGRPPTDARELSGCIARASRPATTAVAGYDLTFSPVKSVSALWALAPRELATRIEEAHAAAVADVLGWLEQHACFTRLGHAGVRQVETTGLVAAVFTHRESRAGDPDLHTHVAVSNKVQTRDGRWRALDGRVLHKEVVVAASERYTTPGWRPTWSTARACASHRAPGTSRAGGRCGNRRHGPGAAGQVVLAAPGDRRPPRGARRRLPA